MSEELLQEARDAFKAAQEAEKDNRKQQLDDLRFARLGEQWEDKDKENRSNEGRPCLTVNRMPSFIRQVVNDARMNKPSIKVHPVDDQADSKTADVINGLIRNIEVTSNADTAYDTAMDFAVSSGVGYFTVDVDYATDDAFDLDITIDRVINPLTVYGDPYSTAADSSDWNVAFVTEMMPLAEFKRRFPDAEKIDFEVDFEGDEYLDWHEGSEKVRVADWWTREEVDITLYRLSDGSVVRSDVFEENADYYQANAISVTGERPAKTHKVTKRIINGKEILEEDEWVGRYIPIIPVYGDEVIIEGKRHFLSLIHFAKDSQRMYNYWRTATAELVALAPKSPFIGEEGAFDVDPNWDTANTETHPFLVYAEGKQPPQRQPFAGPPAGALQEALNSSDDMKAVMGLYDASMGARSNETSGIAIMSRQREGDVSTFNFIDNMTRAIRHAGKVIVDLIPHVYSSERIVRILGEDETPQTVAVNRQFQSPEEMLQGHRKEQNNMEEFSAIYDLTAGKYDVTVKSGPSFTTQRQEATQAMLEMVRAFPQAAPVIGDILAKNMDWPGADEIAERLKTLLPPHLQEDNPETAMLKQKMAQMDQAMKALMSDKSAERAKLELERMKLQIDQFRAETDRAEAQAKIAESQKEPVNEPDHGLLINAELKRSEMATKTQSEAEKMALEREKLTADVTLEREKLALEQEKVALEREKLIAEQCRYETSADPSHVDASPPEMPAPPPVQVFNVQPNQRNIELKYGADGKIVGGTVSDVDG